MNAPPPPPPSGEAHKPSLADRYASAGFSVGAPGPSTPSAPIGEGPKGFESTRVRNAHDPNKTLFLIALGVTILIGIALAVYTVIDGNQAEVTAEATVELEENSEMNEVVPAPEVTTTGTASDVPPWVPTYVADENAPVWEPPVQPAVQETGTASGASGSQNTTDAPIVPPPPDETTVEEDAGPLTATAFAYNAVTKGKTLTYGDSLTFGYDGSKSAASASGYTGTEYIEVNGTKYEMGNTPYEKNKFTTLYMAPPVSADVECTDADPLVQYMNESLAGSGQSIPQDKMDEICAAMAGARFPAGSYTYSVELYDGSGALTGSYEAAPFTIVE